MKVKHLFQNIEIDQHIIFSKLVIKMIFLGILTKNIDSYCFPMKSFEFPDPIYFQFDSSDSKFFDQNKFSKCLIFIILCFLKQLLIYLPEKLQHLMIHIAEQPLSPQLFQEPLLIVRFYDYSFQYLLL